MIGVAHLGGYTWDTTGRVEAGVGALIGERLAARPAHAATVTARLREVSGDCRLAAVYLRPDTPDDVVQVCERLAATADPHERARLQHALGRRRFARPGTAEVLFADDLEQVLAAADDRTRVHVPDRAYRDLVGVLLHDLGAGFADFVESQHEVPGPNARIRQGIVKSWHLPDGTRVISKRVNPAKPGRFTRELLAYRDVAARLAGPVTFGRSRQLLVAPLLAAIRDGTSGQLYAVWQWVPGSTAESVLLQPGSHHRPLLRDVRDLMDALLDRGILWGDLSPRNILIDGRVHHLVDFEKTQLTDGPVPMPGRVAYCRGQVGVEELGVLCPPNQLRQCLHGYFDPDRWDDGSTAPVPFPLRPEVAAVLAGRGITDPDLGTYNRADREIWQVRAPDLDPATGRRRYPGLINFRVEHYLSCAGRPGAGDYDRTTTEVLIAGRRHGCFDDAVRAVAAAVDEVERQFVIAEVAALLAGNDTAPIPAPRAAIRALTASLDALDTTRQDPGRFRAACTNLIQEAR